MRTRKIVRKFYPYQAISKKMETILKNIPKHSTNNKVRQVLKAYREGYL